MTNNKKKKKNPLILVLIVIAIVIGSFWFLWPSIENVLNNQTGEGLMPDEQLP